MHPHRYIEERSCFSTACADTLDKDQGARGRDLDRAITPVFYPRRWPVSHRCSAIAKRNEGIFDEQVGPAEKRMMPSNIIGVDDRNMPIQCRQALSQRRLPRPAAPIDRDYDEGPRSAPLQLAEKVEIAATTPRRPRSLGFRDNHAK
jgi:hypothetical protein